MSASLSKWIKLNVGGQYFQTTLTTLLSCPDSLLAKMFDPESGLEPAYSEDGVYFLDTNPKYFSVILDWLRYKKIMADSDVSLGNVIEAAKFFGLEELVQALEAKVFQDELKKVGAIVVVADESYDAAEKVGDYLGFYLKETDIAYRQAGGEMYLYQARNGVWLISNNMDGEEAKIKNETAKQAKIVPYMGWEFYSCDKYRRWYDNDGLKIITPAELKMCNSITLSFPESKCKDSEAFLGKYERISGDWLNGWPVFRNQKGNYLQVPVGTSQWRVGDSRNYEECLEDLYIKTKGVTTCPANGEIINLSGPNGIQEKWKIKCDVHGKSAE